jgi:hypothetical protein
MMIYFYKFENKYSAYDPKIIFNAHQHILGDSIVILLTKCLTKNFKSIKIHPPTKWEFHCTFNDPADEAAFLLLTNDGIEI